MLPINNEMLRNQLVDRKNRLQEATRQVPEVGHLVNLLREVDAALERMDDGSWGLCEVCHDPIEADRLMIDPTTRFCLDHLTPGQQKAIEQDLELASRIQGTLLPPNNHVLKGWQCSYIYQPAGPVSGDYCDIVSFEDQPDDFLFILGDVSGKGVSASLLMSHLHAMFHSLTAFNLPLSSLMERANRLFCESSLTTHYATIVCGKASASGTVEICNAGHLPLLRIHSGGVEKIDSNSMPVGLFCEAEFPVTHLRVDRGDVLLLFSDGLSESWNNGNEYGLSRVFEVGGGLVGMQPGQILNAYQEDVKQFMAGGVQSDDLTIMAIGKH